MLRAAFENLTAAFNRAESASAKIAELPNALRRVN